MCADSLQTLNVHEYLNFFTKSTCATGRFDFPNCYHPGLRYTGLNTMNRRKKITQLLKAHAKKASAKLAPKNKVKYISKADRLKLAVEAEPEHTTTAES